MMAMASEKSSYIQRTFRIPPELVKQLDEYTKRTGVPRNFVMIQALKAFFEKQEQTSGSNV